MRLVREIKADQVEVQPKEAAQAAQKHQNAGRGAPVARVDVHASLRRDRVVPQEVELLVDSALGLLSHKRRWGLGRRAAQSQSRRAKRLATQKSDRFHFGRRRRS
eukprot:scaffold1245_cov252-Pinguiococcus_pyrenoidosus.AAC.5